MVEGKQREEKIGRIQEKYGKGNNNIPFVSGIQPLEPLPLSPTSLFIFNHLYNFYYLSRKPSHVE